jgi:glyoxylase-like metal-dependent hydrolase (beta-lactamase superfamily II)
LLQWTTYDLDPSVVTESAAVGFAAANCYLVGCSETLEGVVIDPGTMDTEDTREVADEARRLGLRIRYILNTHGHPDHMSGNDYLKVAVGGEVLIHQLDALKLTDPVRNASTLFGMDLHVSPPDALLRDGDVIRFGKLSLTVAHTPGHSSGGVAFLGDGYVFTGDTLFAGSIGRSDLPDSSDEGTSAYDVLLGSIRDKLLTLPDETVVLAGHGPATTIGRERKSNPFLA